MLIMFPPCVFVVCVSSYVYLQTVPFCVFIIAYIFVFFRWFLFPGSTCLLAGNGLHVLGQRADMETTAVISGTTSRAFNTLTSNARTHRHTKGLIYCNLLIIIFI